MAERDPKPDPTCYGVVVRGLCNEGALHVAKDTTGQMISYGVGLTPSLRESVCAVFGDTGRGVRDWEVANWYEHMGDVLRGFDQKYRIKCLDR